ncbi:hypothetical protein [Zoogloea sp.]|uniref:hypothetical protein n=1 Tax=Zoogloea sp. TaxID=49181 RepID=UPI002638C868|nr:hypothetical protein [Zoogloea sp.]MDD3353164.1 hypothetical protein [Zoogloea sp.]
MSEIDSADSDYLVQLFSSGTCTVQGVGWKTAQKGRPRPCQGLGRFDNSQCWRGFSTMTLFLGKGFRYTPQVFSIAIFEVSFIEVSGP